MLDLLVGFVSVSLDVFLQVHLACTASSCPCRGTNQQPCLVIGMRMQRIYLRNLPSVDKVGGPADGMTCIVTGPTRCVLTPCALALLPSSYALYSSQAPPASY